MFEELFSEALRWYNLPWSILLALTTLYWLVAIVGMIDFDFLDFDFDFVPMWKLMSMRT